MTYATSFFGFCHNARSSFFFSDTEAKFHDKRQTTTQYYFQPQQSKFQSQHPLTRPYFLDPRYQYSSGYRNTRQGNRLMKSLQRTLPTSPNAKAIKPQSHGYISYYYPHRTYYKDWSRKVLAARAYAKKLQTSRQQQILVTNQKASQGNAGINLFVARVKPNGNLLGQWISQNNLQQPNNQRNQGSVTSTQSSGTMGPVQQRTFPATTASINSGLSVNKAALSKLQPQLTMNPTSQNVNAVSPMRGKTNSNTGSNVNSRTPVGPRKQALQQQTQTTPPLGKGATKQSSLHEAILSDNLGGAALGPNAHSLLQSDTSKQTPWNGAHSENPQRQSGPTRSNAVLPVKSGSQKNFDSPNPARNANMKLQSKVISRQGQMTNSPVNKGPGNVQNNFQESIARLSSNSNLLPKQVTLYAGQAPVPAPKSQSHPWPSQISPIPNGQPNNKNFATQNNSPGNAYPNQTPLDRELALKNLLFPATAAAKTQAVQSAPRADSQAVTKDVSPQQMVPSFPAFRYGANHPDILQNVHASYRRNNIARAASVPNIKAFLEQTHNPVPYKGSFPLMLHKISPYFKMKRNLKQASSGQAKARRRFLELQSK